MYQNNTINSEEKSNVLVDKTKAGKVSSRGEKKIDNVRYLELLHILEFTKAERVTEWAEVLEYKLDIETNGMNLFRVWFCKARLGPMCNWRRTMKHGTQTQKIVA